MPSIFDDLMAVSERVGSYTQTDSQYWITQDCSTCNGPSRMVVIAYSRITPTQWLRCLTCSSAFVNNYGVTSPTAKPLSVPLGVQGIELEAWNEVRECLGVGANTAAVMMCRKLLFHIAVANGLVPAGENGRAPNFSQAVDHLFTTGLVSPRARRWVEQIKKVGNEANHEIVSIPKEVALDIATFTEQLLRMTYEMDMIMARHVPDAEGVPGEPQN